MNLIIRECRLPDDLIPLTDLLHRAYAKLAAHGLRFVASHQDVAITERRIRSGTCFVAEVGDQLVGTITVRAPVPGAQIPVYREAGTFSFAQFGVDPHHCHLGIGRSLHQLALHVALAQNATAMVLNTAAPARELIHTYERWGYREVARHRWDATNYESIVMKMDLTTKVLTADDRRIGAATLAQVLRGKP